MNIQGYLFIHGLAAIPQMFILGASEVVDDEEAEVGEWRRLLLQSAGFFPSKQLMNPNEP